MEGSGTLPDPAVLGRIMLLQSAVHAAPDAARLSGVLLAGMSAIPGVDECFVCLQGNVTGLPDDSRAAEKRHCHALGENGPAIEYCSEHCPLRKERDGWKRHLLRTSRSAQGVLQIKISSEADFKPYELFVGNTANLIALHLENLGTTARLADLNRKLERQAEERTVSLIESERRLHLALDAADAGIWEWDLRTNANVWSDEFWKLCGLAPRTCEPSLEAWRSVVHPDDLAGVEHVLEQAARQGTDLNVEFRVRDRLGAPRWLLARGHPLRDENGRVERLAGIVLDITHRKQSEEAVHESRRRLRAALASMNDAVFISDVSGTFVEFNHAFATFHRFANEEECLKTFVQYPAILDVFFPDGTLAPLDMWAVPRALRGETIADAEYTLQRKDTGEIWIGSYSFAPIRDKDGVIVGSVVVCRDITGRKRTEEALRASEQSFRAIFENAPMGIGIADGDGHIQQCSPAFCALLGYAEEELRGVWFGSLIAPGDRDAAAASAARFRTGKIRFFESDVRCIRKDGQKVWVHRVASALPGENGGPEHILVLATDITDRKQAEDALRQSQMRLHLALDAAHSGAWEWDLRTNANIWSEELWKLYGLEPDSREPSYETWLSIVHPEDRAEVERTVREAARTGITLNAEWRVAGSAGDVRWLMSRGQPLRGDNGEVVRFLGIVVDITERKRAEEALRAAQERYRLISENTGDVIWSLDLASRRYTYVSPSVKRLRGYTAEEALSQTLEQALTPESFRAVTECLRNRIAAFIQGEESSRLRIDEVDQPRKDGSVVVTEVVTTLLADEHGQPTEVVGVSRDVTERKCGEQALRDSREELARLNGELERRVAERTEQLEAANQELEAFAYSVSHDLRTPLRAVDGFSAALTEDFGPQLPPEAQRFVGLIRDGARRMATLIDDLLSFSRLSKVPLTKRAVNTGQLVSESLEDLRSQIGEREIDFCIQDLPECLGDPRLLKQVWVNLLSNAIKYTRPRQQAAIQVGCEKQSGEDVYFIRDNGAGFDMRYADKLFGVFQRLHSAAEFEGTGVGLANVQRIVRRHGGRVWADAEVDKGATFFFTLAKADSEKDAKS